MQPIYFFNLITENTTILYDQNKFRKSLFDKKKKKDKIFMMRYKKNARQ